MRVSAGQVRIAAAALLLAASPVVSARADEDVTAALDQLIASPWTAPAPDWFDRLLDHVDQNVDPAVPLEPNGWTATLRFLAYDCWSPPQDPQADRNSPLALRSYVNCGVDDRLAQRMSDIAWVLIRHEFDNYRSTRSQRFRAAAGWSLEQATAEYMDLVNGAEPRSSEPAAIRMRRLSLIRSFTAELAAKLDGAKFASDATRRQEVREEIDRQLALDGSGVGDAFGNIITPLRQLARDVMDSYIAGINATETAKAVAVLVYGGGRFEQPNSQGAEVTPKALSSAEKAELIVSALRQADGSGALYDFVAAAQAERPAAIGIVEQYADLKRLLWQHVPEGVTAADALDADSFMVRWPGAEDGKLSLRTLETEPGVVGTIGSANTLTNLCEKQESGTGRCALRILVDRSIPEQGADIFNLAANETEIHGVLQEIVAHAVTVEDGDPVEALVDGLRRQTTHEGTVVFQLPYLGRATFADGMALCDDQATPAVVRAAVCPPADKDGTVLAERLARVIRGTPRAAQFNEKIDGLLRQLHNVAASDGPDLFDPATETLRQPETSAFPDFVFDLCKSIGLIAAAADAAGLRGISLIGACSNPALLAEREP